MDSQFKSSGLVLGRRPLDAVLHSSNEPGELSQWLCHDDSTINIVLDIIIIIIIPGREMPQVGRKIAQGKLGEYVTLGNCLGGGVFYTLHSPKRGR